jgi:hypothetical protein
MTVGRLHGHATAYDSIVETFKLGGFLANASFNRR